MDFGPRVFSGTSNPKLTEEIVQYIGIEPGKVEIKRFSDGEIWVKFRENIRGRDVFIVQPTNPPADNLLELLIMIDAAKRASAKRVTAVIPYFGYSRQDRKDQPRVSLAAKLVANMITHAGTDKVISIDLHAPQIQGFFDIPFDHLYSSPIFLRVFEDKKDNLVVVSPDVGGIKVARSFAKRLDLGLVVIDKRRPSQNVAEVMNIIGDVKGKNVLLVDDIIDTAGTFVNAVKALKDNGAVKIYGAVTHAVLSGAAYERIENSEVSKLYVTDSIPLRKDYAGSKIVAKSSANILAESILRSNRHQSVSSLFENNKE